MIIAPVRAADLLATDGNRLDAKYFASPAVQIRKAFAGSPGVHLKPIGGRGGLGTVWAPKRFRRVYAAPGEDFVSYLRPYDVFEYLPPEADRLSVTRTEDLDQYLIREGDLLQTCSGRNLGPLTIADKYLSRFALSHDMLRITIEDEDDRFYVLAFLRTRVGQHLLRGDLSGSVIDHITAEQVAAIQVPVIRSVRDQVVEFVREAVELRERAREALHDAVEDLNRTYSRSAVRPLREGWTVRATSLGSRLDAAFHSKSTRSLRDALTVAGGVRLGDVCTVLKPGGRYKTYYVDPEHGTPLLSGRQILQAEVVGAKSISARSVSADTGYELRTGWVIFQADGRAEESLGYPSVVTEERDGWFASGHVGRAVPKDPVDSGWVWASMASGVVREQVAALACGSVVDALYPEELEGVVLPPRDEVLSVRINNAWGDIATATELLARAVAEIESTLPKFGL